MKHWHCPNCHRKSLSEDNIIIKLCPCGEYVVESLEEKDGRKEQIIEILKGKESVPLKEIYLNLSNIKKESIRAIINADIKKGITFERLKKGEYKLK